MIETYWDRIISENPSLCRVGENIWAEEGAIIEDGAQIEGNLIIGRGSTIKKNTIIRGYNVIGRDVLIGNFVEIKNTLIYDGVQLPHLSYVGDSVLGYYSHLGAGVKVSNFKSWGNEINITFDDVKLATGLEKLGAIVGDRADVGCNSVLYPATLIGRGCVVYPLTGVRGTIDNDTLLRPEGTRSHINR
jgi:NDP-sugar pyrophosphorylase family protein